MPPAATMPEHNDDSQDYKVSLIDMASSELEELRTGATKLENMRKFPQFPAACLSLLKSADGNSRCVDCGAHDPQWASVSYGALLCLQCSGHHRSFGVQVSRVRSIHMDEWAIPEVLAMLEGGNEQLSTFFSRHSLSVEDCANKNKAITKDTVTKLRYKTKAAEFYRQQMDLHVSKLMQSGPYRGRAQSRRKQQVPSVDRRNSTV